MLFNVYKRNGFGKNEKKRIHRIAITNASTVAILLEMILFYFAHMDCNSMWHFLFHLFNNVSFSSFIHLRAIKTYSEIWGITTLSGGFINMNHC